MCCRVVDGWGLAGWSVFIQYMRIGVLQQADDRTCYSLTGQLFYMCQSNEQQQFNASLKLKGSTFTNVCSGRMDDTETKHVNPSFPNHVKQIT